jgi:hypothetical protein
MRVFVATILFIGAALLYGVTMWLTYHAGRAGWTIFLAFVGALGVYDLAKEVLTKAELIHPSEDKESNDI